MDNTTNEMTTGHIEHMLEMQIASLISSNIGVVHSVAIVVMERVMRQAKESKSLEDFTASLRLAFDNLVAPHTTPPEQPVRS